MPQLWWTPNGGQRRLASGRNITSSAHASVGAHCTVPTALSVCQPTCRQGARATINGRLDIRSNDVWYWDLEVTILDDPPPIELTREEQNIGYNEGVYRLSNLEIRGYERNRLINNLIHNNHIGTGFSTGSTDAEFYGNIVYNNGRMASDLPSGHGIYAQNIGADGFKKIRDNIVGNSYLNGLNLFSAGSSFVQNLEVNGNILFSNGIYGSPLYGTNLYAEAPNPMQDLSIDGNLLYTPKPGTYVGPAIANGFIRGIGGETGISITNNVLANSGILILFLDQLSFNNNRVGPRGEFQLRFPADEAISFDYEINSNTYSQVGFNPWFWDAGVYAQLNTGATNAGFAQWQSVLSDQAVFGAEALSSFTESAPSDFIVYFRPNEYQTGRANIAILAFGEQQAFDVNIGDVLEDGTSWELRKVDDFFGQPVLTGTLAGTSISIPRSLLGQLPNTNDDFGVWILLDSSLMRAEGVFEDGFE